MKVLVVHNRYKRAGGEDTVFVNEVEALRLASVDVTTLTQNNDEIAGPISRFSAAASATWSFEAARRVRDALVQDKPDVVHVHNFFPKLSPSIFWMCHRQGVPVVLTLHNFRVTCANGLLFRDGKPCELCVGRSPWPGVRHRCYRDSYAGSAAVASMIEAHKRLGTWREKVSRFIALNGFARELFVRSGLPHDRITIKANMLADPAINGLGSITRRGAIYVGRLSSEKGVSVLINAWRKIDAPLLVVGDGPERARLESGAPANVRFLGHQPQNEVNSLISKSCFLVVPSVWYENYPMAVVEASALSTPTIASNLGSLKSIVEDGVTGHLFASGDAEALAETSTRCLANKEQTMELGRQARLHYERTSAPSVNVAQLLSIYEQVIHEARQRL